MAVIKKILKYCTQHSPKCGVTIWNKHFLFFNQKNDGGGGGNNDSVQ